MSKMVTDVLSKTKGEDKINDVLTGKGSFSKAGFSDMVNAMVNDTTFKIKKYDKDGKPAGEVNISELIRADVQKTVENAKYPQKSETAVLSTSEISTKGLAEAIPYIVMEQIKQGKKFDLPTQPNVQGSVYLANVPGSTKTRDIRDIQSNEKTGTVTTTTKDYIQVRAKSPVPDSCVVSKVRKDLNGNVVDK